MAALDHTTRDEQRGFLEQAVLEHVASERLELPLLPGGAVAITRATQDYDTDARKLADVIQRDAAIAAHVLRIANSPLYRPSSPIVSLQQAVARLGMGRIRDIAMIIACQVGVFRVPGFDAEMRRLFTHALLTSLYASEIARSRRQNVEQSFLCGLLHNVGSPVVIKAALDVARNHDLELDLAEVGPLVARLHGVVGARLARTWELPDKVCEAIEQHGTAGEGAPAHVAMTQLADLLARHAEQPSDASRAALDACPALGVLEIYPDALEELAARGQELAKTAREMW